MSSGTSTRENSPTRYKRYLPQPNQTISKEGLWSQNYDKQGYIKQWLLQLQCPNISPEVLIENLGEAHRDNMDDRMCEVYNLKSSTDSTPKSSDGGVGMFSSSPATSLDSAHPETDLEGSLADAESIPGHNLVPKDSFMEIQNDQ
ncbi:hypothetical protein PpBr36_06819 [Pyricularia pennisetigena]|uniref:hypothetical protein n=1 Tax=Pyricularia pennisetigena TaxID=1578925 RepID=UPI00114D5F7A|nr:hypothetical protein PpBr36_06819 [Pyricularia pennisetigena]TLS25001.1 hypothetical protein PpBr36_06819 [Pyricularia pennisetigena]